MSHWWIKKKNEYTVVDAVPTEYTERVAWIADFCKDFETIILVTFKSNILEVLSNPRKQPLELDEKWNIMFPPQEYIVMNNYALLQEIKSGIIAIGVDYAYILTTEKIDSVKCNIHWWIKIPWHRSGDSTLYKEKQ